MTRGPLGSNFLHDNPIALDLDGNGLAFVPRTSTGPKFDFSGSGVREATSWLAPGDGWLFVDLVYLPDSLRGTGVGTRMMAMAEDEAKARGCVAALLYTISFQAPDFYARLGYRELGRVACLPPGTSRVIMTKRFDGA